MTDEPAATATTGSETEPLQGQAPKSQASGGAAGFGAAPGGAGPDWTATLDDAGRQVLANKGWKTPGEVLSGYVNLEKVLGHEKLPLPPAGKDGSRDFKSWDGWAKLGVPADAKDYAFVPAKGHEYGDADKAFQDGMRPALHEARLAQWQVDVLSKALDANAAAAEQKAAETRAATEQAGRKEFGAAYEARLDLAKRAARQVFGPDLADADQIRLADGSRLLDHFGMLKAFAALGAAMAEDTTNPSANAAGAGLPTTPGQAKAEITKLRGEIRDNPKHPYNDPRHPEHKAMHQRMFDLYAMAETPDR